jgi:hypothetical protein
MAQQRRTGSLKPCKLLQDLIKAALSGCDRMRTNGVDHGYADL